MVKYRVFQACVVGFIALCIWILIPSASATKTTPTCANVRCASGTCIDTPQGPTCTTQTLTCASTLCQVGSKCVETSTGPTCVPNTTGPGYGHTGGHYGNYGPYNYGYGQHYTPPRHHYRGWRRYYRPHQYRPYRPYYGHGYGHGYNPRPKPPVRPEPRFCPQVYQPVCAQKQVQCFRAPCPPVKQTFGNSCEANNAGYTVIYNGTCSGYR